jgi:hypothetical protein
VLLQYTPHIKALKPTLKLRRGDIYPLADFILPELSLRRPLVEGID